jgi:hypothetical protein
VSDRTLAGLIGLVLTGLVVVIGAGAVLGSNSIAGDLGDRARTVLSAAGLEGIAVDFTGREAQLSGGNDVELRRAETLVAALPGVRTVKASAVPNRPLPGVARFELDRAGDDVEISGAVPSPDAAAAIKIASAQGLRAMITGDVTVDPALADGNWVAGLSGALEALAAVRSLAFDIRGDGTVQIGGWVEDSSERTRLVERVAAALPGLRVVDKLEVTSPRTDG